jgi:hypothetical protein
MSWFINSPFGRDEDPLDHMVELLSDEAIKDGVPLTERDREILARENSRLEPMPEVLRQRAKDLITRIFEGEPLDEFGRDPKCFSCSLQWAGDGRYPNIVALAEEVACDIARPSVPLLGWKRVKDKLQLVGCGLLLVLLMFAIVIGAGFLFGWK